MKCGYKDLWSKNKAQVNINSTIKPDTKKKIDLKKRLKYKQRVRKNWQKENDIKFQQRKTVQLVETDTERFNMCSINIIRQTTKYKCKKLDRK